MSSLYEHLGECLKEVVGDAGESEALLPYVATVLKQTGGESAKLEEAKQQLKDVVDEGRLDKLLSDVTEHAAANPEEALKFFAPPAAQQEQQQQKKRARSPEGDAGMGDELPAPPSRRQRFAAGDGSEEEEQQQQHHHLQDDHERFRGRKGGGRGGAGSVLPQHSFPPAPFAATGGLLSLLGGQSLPPPPQLPSLFQPLPSTLGPDPSSLSPLTQLMASLRGQPPQPAPLPQTALSTAISNILAQQPNSGPPQMIGGAPFLNPAGPVNQHMMDKLQRLRTTAMEQKQRQRQRRLACILVVAKVPPMSNTEEALRGHFEKFGKISVVLCAGPPSNKAFIVYHKRSSVFAARECSDAVLGNRFIVSYPCERHHLEELIKIPLKPSQIVGPGGVRPSAAAPGAAESQLAEKEQVLAQCKAEVNQRNAELTQNPDDETVKQRLAESVQKLQQTSQEVAELKELKDKAAAQQQQQGQQMPWWWSDRKSNTLDTRPKRVRITRFSAAVVADPSLKNRETFSSFGEIKEYLHDEESDKVEVEFTERWQAENCMAHIENWCGSAGVEVEWVQRAKV